MRCIGIKCYMTQDVCHELGWVLVKGDDLSADSEPECRCPSGFAE